MKKMLLLSVAIAVIAVLFLPRAFAADYTQWHLPAGAEARLGKGWINAQEFSPRWNAARCRDDYRYLDIRCPQG